MDRTLFDCCSSKKTLGRLYLVPSDDNKELERERADNNAAARTTLVELSLDGWIWSRLNSELDSDSVSLDSSSRSHCDPHSNCAFVIVIPITIPSLNPEEERQAKASRVEFSVEVKVIHLYCH